MDENGHVCSLANNEKHFYDDVADDGRPLVGALHGHEGGVVRNHNGDVERTEQNQPVPADLEYAVVEQDQARSLNLLHLVLGNRSPGQVLNLKG